MLISLLLAAPGGAARADRTDDEAIQEAVVRDHLKPPVQREEIYFLSIDRDNDPSEALLARLADLKVDVRKRSRAIVRTDVPGAKSQTVFDRRTNEPEILLELGHIRRRDRPIANVELRRYRGKLNASYYEYTLRKRDGRWTVNRRDKVGQS